MAEESTVYKICECGRVCTTKQGYCSHHGKCKVAHPEKDFSYLKGRHWTQTAWNLGLTKETDERVSKISKSLLAQSDHLSKIQKETVKRRNPDQYSRQAETRKYKFSIGELNPPPRAGRGKYSYIVYNDNKIMLRSTYEFIYALYLLYHHIDFEYESVRVPAVTNYEYSRTFISDFKVGNKIIEIKGYHSSKVDHAKEAFESAGYEYEVKYKEDILPCYEYLKSTIDIDDILSKIVEGHNKKEYYVHKFIQN